MGQRHSLSILVVHHHHQSLDCEPSFLVESVSMGSALFAFARFLALTMRQCIQSQPIHVNLLH
jgi:hypothetical protein